MIFNLTREGIEIPAGKLDSKTLGTIKRRLTVTSKGFGDRMTTMQAHSTNRRTGIVAIARMRGIVELARAGHTVKCQIGAGVDIPAERLRDSTLALKTFQEPIVRHLITKVFSPGSIELGMSSAILDLEPGKGKSFVAAAIVQHFGKKTLIVTPGKDLTRQTRDVYHLLFPHMRVGEYSGSHKTDGDVVVMCSNSAASGDTYTFTNMDDTKTTMSAKAYFDQFGVTIIDEIHTMCTKQRASVFSRCQSLITLGVSGTCAHRIDQMDPVMYHWVGTPIDARKLMPVAAPDAAPEWKFEAHCLRYHGPTEFTRPLLSSLGTVSHSKMITQFSCDPWRSQLLVNTIRALVAEKHQVFVMLDRTELCDLAYKYLLSELKETTVDLAGCGIITGKVKEAAREQARFSNVVVGSYQCIGTGISFDEFTAVVFWHSRRNNFKQFLNRIFREDGDRAITRKAYFLQDAATSIKTQYYGFTKVCKEERNVTPVVAIHEYTKIEVSPEIKKIAADFELWIAEQAA
jgi:hypothetical protein